jgi:hypothetical protein
MKIFNNENGLRKVYVQMNDIMRLNQTDETIPTSIYEKFFTGIFIVDESNRMDFVEFSQPEEIEFFESMDWIVDYKQIRDLSKKGIKTEGQSQMPFPIVPDSDGFSFVGDDNCDYEIRASLDPNKLLLFRKDGKKLSSKERIPRDFLQTGISIAAMEKSQNDNFLGDYEISNSFSDDGLYLVIDFKVKSYKSSMEEDKSEEKGIKRLVKKIFPKKKK